MVSYEQKKIYISYNLKINLDNQQSFYSDPVTGPAEDLGIRLSFNLQQKDGEEKEGEETDGGGVSHSDNNNALLLSGCNNEIFLNTNTENCFSSSQVFYHIPTFCDMLIGYPTQRGFIAYRKPEIGSWYMNAIVQVLSKHAHDTDLCAMLNMVNSLICNEVTNTGKKQMSEFTSKLTKPYFYFFPGLASSSMETPAVCDLSSRSSSEKGICGKKKQPSDEVYEHGFLIRKKKRAMCLSGGGEQSDSHSMLKLHGIEEVSLLLSSDVAGMYWKSIAREMNIREHQIVAIDRDTRLNSVTNKLKAVLDAWLVASTSHSKENKDSVYYVDRVVQVLTACRLNKVKGRLRKNFFK